MEDIIDADWEHAKCVCKGFEIENVGEYDLHDQRITLLLADVFENFRNICLTVYKLKSISALGLVW